MRDNTHRFTGKGAVYAAARPRYAEGLFEFLASCPNAAPGSVIADIGSGTGIFSEQLIEHGWEVVGVEPNDDMRAKAERRLGNTGMFESVRATADRTGLPAHSVDCVTAAQAFHWFDAEGFRAECRRILKPGGIVAIVYNKRDKSSPSTRVLAALNRKFDPSFTGFSSGIDDATIRAFFGGACTVRSWDNAQMLTCNVFVNRALSSSHAPGESDPQRDAFVAELEALFDQFAVRRADVGEFSAVIEIPLSTVVYAGNG